MINLIDCGKYEFYKKTADKKIFCFGGGKQLKTFIEKNKSIKLSGIIDNYRCGAVYKINSSDDYINIISAKQFAESYDGKCVVIITCFAYEEIIEQLDSIPELNGMDCYIDLFLEQYTEHFEEKLVPNSKKQNIPKKIHYCWFGEKELPDEYKAYINTWEQHCPDYEIIRWDETNYDIAKSRYMKQAYENQKWAFVSDYARVDIIYHYGGIYLDTDVEMIKNFNEFLNWDMFCGFENNAHVNWGIAFGATKGNIILKEVLEKYDNIDFISQDGSFNLTGCPILQSNVMEKHGFVMNGKPQNIGNVAVYPKEYFAPFGCIKGFGRITDNTHSIHHYSASWVDEGTQKYFRRWISLTDKVKMHGKGIGKDLSYSSVNKISPTKRYQIWTCPAETETAGSKAPCDIREIAGQCGYQVINIHPIRGLRGTDTWNWSSRQNEDDWSRCYELIPPNAILLLQHPFWQKQAEREKTIIKLKEEKHVKIVSFVHDIEKLRGVFVDTDMQQEFSFMLDYADVLIVHNSRMAGYLSKQGIKRDKLVELDIFDYLSSARIGNRTNEASVVIAGNLDQQKSGYLQKLGKLSNIKFHLFGPNYKENPNTNNIEYHGSYPIEKITDQLYGGFGLVWDGDDLETCLGATGNYLRYNNPHKLSLYLASGIPVFIWSEAAEAEFVKEHGVGVTISSLYDVPQILQNMTKERYNQYLIAVNEIAGQLRAGKYTRQALEKSEKIILEEIDDGRL